MSPFAAVVVSVVIAAPLYAAIALASFLIGRSAARRLARYDDAIVARSR